MARRWSSHSVASAALASLTHLPIGAAPDFSQHDPLRRIGVITGASVSGDDLIIQGSLFSQDYPVVAATIKERQKDLGCSFEAAATFEDGSADVLVAKSISFTGAALLWADAAIFSGTSIHAAADRPPLPLVPGAQRLAGQISAAIDLATQPHRHQQRTRDMTSKAEQIWNESVVYDKNISDSDKHARYELSVRVRAMEALEHVLSSAGAKISSSDLSVALADRPPAERIKTKMDLHFAGKLMTADEERHLPELQAQAVIDALQNRRAVAPGPMLYLDPRLMRALSAVGITEADDGQRLTSAQLACVLANASVSERILLKLLVEQAGIEPRQLAVA